MKIKTLFLMCALGALVCARAQAKIIYVDDDATGTNDGSSWQNAYTYLRDALTAADSDEMEKPLEIRAAQGIYKPNQGFIPVVAPGTPLPGGPSPGVWPEDQGYSATFPLFNNVTLKGGYAGLTEFDPNERNIELYETILSGDLDGNDIDVNKPSYLFYEPTRSDNCNHVISCSSVDKTAVLDGFIITGGRARRNGGVIDYPTGIGGGMKIYSGSPTINNCTFTGNSAQGSGGGIYNYGNMYEIDDNNPIVTNCKFIGNSGGGVSNSTSAMTFIGCTFKNNYSSSGAGLKTGSTIGPPPVHNLKLINCIFEENTANYNGGAIILYDDKIELTNCMFIRNHAGHGGGMYCDYGNPNINFCYFIENYAQHLGGGLASDNEANPIIKNCTFIGNLSNKSGGAIAGPSSTYNSIFSGNVANEDGGAISGWGEIINSTITGNKAMYNGGGVCTQGIINLKNNIIRNNKAFSGNEIYLSIYNYATDRGVPIIEVPSELTTQYNNIQNLDLDISIETDCKLFWGSGNIDIDPCFADTGLWDSNDTPENPNDDFWIEGDYHLKSQAGRWDPSTQTFVQDDVTSPCIDSGDPNSPIGLEPFPNGGYINMGAYGGTNEASKSYFGKPLCETIVAGDINGDCKVDLLDMEIMMFHWLEDNNP